MRFTGEASADGVTERLFELEVAGDRVPGVVWAPEHVTGTAPLLLMGHGGSQHKKGERLVARARHFVATLGLAVAAIDAPEHGERVTPEQAAAYAEQVRTRIAERRRVSGDLAQTMTDRATKAVPEWQATLDALTEVGFIGAGGPVGYWGVSMGTIIGVPFVAAEPRITAAVFGLSGLVTPAYQELAGRITAPVEFVFQWDDELVARDSGIALFDAFGAAEKTLHVNPGGHLGIPDFELASWTRFFGRHLIKN